MAARSKTEIPIVRSSTGELHSIWSWLVLLMLDVMVGDSLIQVCKFILSNRTNPHVGRGYTKVHFVRISFEVT